MLEDDVLVVGRPKIMTINVEDARQVRRLARHIDCAMGSEASTALREFLANVLQHCSRKDVDVVELPSVLIAYDHGGGIRNPRSRKPHGEGGYGLRIIETLGAELHQWEEGTMFVMMF